MMLKSSSDRRLATNLILLVGTAIMIGQVSFAVAADRSVVGELWSQDG